MKMSNKSTPIDRQCRFVFSRYLGVSPWYSYGNVTFFDAIRRHCNESGLTSKGVNIVEVRCASEPDKIDRFEVQGHMEWEILNPRLGAD